MIRLKDVKMEYPNGTRAIRGISAANSQPRRLGAARLPPFFFSSIYVPPPACRKILFSPPS